ncbi:GerMN domain-containing protein [Sedimentibacter saalensis]|uniref:GerMN domain-containing protein n=1 Tax=Sedimentibacter saalensis TaxID=130788 RepID=UPI00289C12E0|nr:GerMN domain-containing protein [Sedimentibacter saalensis]
MKKIFLKDKIVIIIISILLFSLIATSCGSMDTNGADKVKNTGDFEILEADIEKETEEEKPVTLQDTKMKDITVYYEDESGFVVPVFTQIPWTEGIAKMTLKCMVVGSETEKRIAKSGFHGLLPEGTEIRGMAIKDGVCKIDFNKNILNTSSYEQEENMITAITYTLTEFPTIDKVELLVGGQKLDTLSKGYEINKVFEKENINLYDSTNGINYTIYYKSLDTEDEGHYVPITFSFNIVNKPFVSVVEKLFSGAPAELNLSNNIPEYIKLRGVEVKEDTAIVNLGADAVNLTEQEFNDMNTVVVLCLEQFDIENVDYQVEGMSFEEAGMDWEDDYKLPSINKY